MPKIISKNKTEQNRNRVRIFRGVQSILRQDRNINQFIQNRNLANPIPRYVPRQASNDLPQFTNRGAQTSLVNEIRSWALDFHLTQRAVSRVLKILIAYGLKFLPKDSRTLLQTPQSMNIERRAGGQYWHNSLKKSLFTIFSKDLNKDLVININFNVDGLPLFKSSTIEFWPILGKICGK